MSQQQRKSFSGRKHRGDVGNLGYKLVRMTDILQINPHLFASSPVYFVSFSHQTQFYMDYPTLEAKPDFGSHVTSRNQSFLSR